MKFEEWLSQQGGLIEVDCGCVTTEAFCHWLRAAYESGALTNEGTIHSCNSSQPVTVPAGYVLVPVEPTTNQWAAGMQAFDSGMDKVTRVYKAMLAAAPTEPDGLIPVNERMPLAHFDGCEYSDIEVSAFDGEHVFTAHYAVGSLPQPWGDWVDTNANITHWQPLPDAPKVKP